MMFVWSEDSKTQNEVVNRTIYTDSRQIITWPTTTKNEASTGQDKLTAPPPPKSHMWPTNEAFAAVSAHFSGPSFWPVAALQPTVAVPMVRAWHPSNLLMSQHRELRLHDFVAACCSAILSAPLWVHRIYRDLPTKILPGRQRKLWPTKFHLQKPMKVLKNPGTSRNCRSLTHVIFAVWPPSFCHQLSICNSAQNQLRPRVTWGALGTVAERSCSRKKSSRYQVLDSNCSCHSLMSSHQHGPRRNQKLVVVYHKLISMKRV